MKVFETNDGTGSYQEFLSFCLEINESTDYSSVFKIDGINNYAANGGIGGAMDYDPGVGEDLRDPIDKKTAWIYWYANQGDYKYEYKDAQYAIWVIENEIADGDGNWDWVTDNAKALIDQAHDKVGDGNYTEGEVVVYNLSYSSGEKAQSMLAWKDETGGQEPIPEPALLLMLGGGLLGMAGLRRRRRFH